MPFGLVNNCDNCDGECYFIDVIHSLNHRVRYYAGRAEYLWIGSEQNNAGQHINGGMGGCSGLHFYHIDYDATPRTLQKYHRDDKTGVDGSAAWDSPALLSDLTGTSWGAPDFYDWSTDGYPATFLTVNGRFAMWGIGTAGADDTVVLQVRDGSDEGDGVVITEGFLWDLDEEDYVSENTIILNAIPASETRVAVTFFNPTDYDTNEPWSTDVIFVDGKWIFRRHDHEWSKTPSVGFAVKDGLWMGSMVGLPLGPIGPENYLWHSDSLLVRTATVAVDLTANYPLGNLVRTYPSARCGKIYTCDFSFDAFWVVNFARYNIATETIDFITTVGSTDGGWVFSAPHYVVKDTFPGGDDGATEGDISDECNDCGDHDADPGGDDCDDCEYFESEECITGSMDASASGTYSQCPNWYSSAVDPTVCTEDGGGLVYCVGVNGVFGLNCCCGEQSIDSVAVTFENEIGDLLNSYHEDFNADNDPDSVEVLCFGIDCCYVLDRGYRLCLGPGVSGGNTAHIKCTVTVTASNGCTLTLEETLLFYWENA